MGSGNRIASQNRDEGEVRLSINRSRVEDKREPGRGGFGKKMKMVEKGGAWEWGQKTKMRKRVGGVLRVQWGFRKKMKMTEKGGGWGWRQKTKMKRRGEVLQVLC
ncbi:uncharacterized protein J3R85_000471 [Psidium guajava]|nr:uncharacterized protein J3R85_000471 [Psidium guajava]